MRGRILWAACVVTAGLLLLPAPAHGQGAEFPQPDTQMPWPLGHDRIDKGGPFVDGEFVIYTVGPDLRDDGGDLANHKDFGVGPIPVEPKK